MNDIIIGSKQKNEYFDKNKYAEALVKLIIRQQKHFTKTTTTKTLK